MPEKPHESGGPKGPQAAASRLGDALPASLVAAARLDDASVVLLAFAYLTGALCVLAGIAPVFGEVAFIWKILAVLVGVLFGSVLFVTLKYVSEAFRALADVARSAARVEERLGRLEGVPEAEAAPRVPTERGAA